MKIKLFILTVGMLVTIYLNSSIISKISILFGDSIDFLKESVSADITKFMLNILYLIILFLFLDIIQSLVTKLFLEYHLLHLKEDYFNKILYIDPRKENYHVILENVKGVYLETIEQLGTCSTTFFSWHLVILSNALIAIYNSFILNWKLTISLLLIIPMFTIIFKIIGKQFDQTYDEIYEVKNSQINLISSIVDNLNVIKLFNAKEFVLKKYLTKNKNIIENQKKWNDVISKISLVSYIQKLVMAILIISVIMYYFSIGELTLGNAISILSLFTIIRIPIELSGDIFQNIISLVLARKKINSIFSFSLINSEFISSKKIKENLIPIEMNAVSFYSQNIRILSNITLKIQNYKAIGIYGNSGCGKSTLIKAMTKNICYSGQITLFGCEIDQMSYEDIAKCIAIVPQKTFFIEETIEENLAIKTDEEKEKYRYLVKQTPLFSFLKHEKNTVKTAEEYSGGQIQRISILKALIKDTPILLMDEPTASLDKINEQYFISVMGSIKQNKTIIITSHRKSTLMNLDYLYGMANGEIVEEGVPDELFKNKNSKFYKLFVDNQSSSEK